MRALRLEGIGRLGLRDVAPPVPGPGEVLLRVGACGVCGTDRHLLHGEFPSQPPVTLGHEFAGFVEAVGEGVDVPLGALVTGDPNVPCGLCAPCRRGRVNLCERNRPIGIARDGGFAELVVVPVAQAHVVPGHVGAEAAALTEPLACTLHGVDLARLVPGMDVTVLGGGVIGLMAVRLTVLAGARVRLVTRSREKQDLGIAMGAAEAMAETQAQADAVLECAGVPETVAQAPRLTRAGGTAVLLGVLPAGAQVSFEPFDLVFREVSVLGSFVNPFTHARAVSLIASGAVDVRPLISRRLPLEEAAEAISNPPRAGEVRALVIP